MNGSAVTATILIATVATTWAIAGVGDFNSDGAADILWRETTTGRVALWLMNGTTPGTTSLATVIALVPLTWAVALVQDFNGDGHADILWREDDGTVAVWLMNGPTIVTIGTIANVPANWVPR